MIRSFARLIALDNPFLVIDSKGDMVGRTRMKSAGGPGRKARVAQPGTRAALGLRVTHAVKNQLDTAAKQNGRTQSQEAEVRLENSFRNERVLDEVIDLHFGHANGELLLSVFGAVLNAATEALRTQSHTGDWIDDPATQKAVASLLRSLAAGLDGSAEPTNPNRTFAELLMRRFLVRSVMTPDWLAQRRERLGRQADWIEEWVRRLQQQYEIGPRAEIIDIRAPLAYDQSEKTSKD
jgi:hypothetical protein